MSCTSSITDFFLLSSFFFLHLLSLLSQLTETDGAGASLAEWDGTGRDDAGMRDGTGDRRAGGGGRRREEGGLAGNMGTAEAEGQVTKGCEWELRGADSSGRRGR